jgi:hypothetical protein
MVLFKICLFIDHQTKKPTTLACIFFVNFLSIPYIKVKRIQGYKIVFLKWGNAGLTAGHADILHIRDKERTQESRFRANGSFSVSAS